MGARPANPRPANPRPGVKPVPTADQELGGLNDYIGYLLRRAQLAVFQDVIQAMGDFDLRPAQFSTLMIINARPGLRQIEVATQLGIQRTNFVTLFDSLEKRGLAERKPSPEDRRSHSLYLTARGQAFLAEVRAAVDAHEARMADLLGLDDYVTVKRILGKLLPRS